MLLLLLVSSPAKAEPPGLSLYENGEYEAAVQVFMQVLSSNAQRSPQEQGLTRVYLAASLHALGRLEEAQQELEILAREHPEQQVDPVRFLPELAALADEIRQRVSTEQELAQREAERKARDAFVQRPPSTYLRPELHGLYEVLGPGWTMGAGLAWHRGMLEASARMMLNMDPLFSPPRFYPTFQLQGGLLLGSSVYQPHVGLRAVLAPGAGGYGGGAVAGVRLKLPARLVGLVDVGADYFFVTGDEVHQRFALTVQAGLGLDLRLP